MSEVGQDDAGDFVCAECATTTAGTYVVTTLDRDDVKDTRTEVCLDCHMGLNETPVPAHQVGVEVRVIPLTAAVLTEHQQAVLDHYRALVTEPVTWAIGTPGPDGTVEVFAVFAEAIWCIQLDADANHNTSEADFPDGFTTGLTA